MAVNSLLPLVLAAASPPEHWYRYLGVDCGHVDVTPQPPCAGAGSSWGNATQLEGCCDRTPLCVGFNSHNVLKRAGCAARVEPADCALYLRHPLPPPPPLPPPYPAPASQRMAVGLWPQPRSVQSGDASAPPLQLRAGFRIRVVAGASPTLAAIVARYTGLVLLHGAPPAAAGLGECTVAVQSTGEVLSMGMDESYALNVTAGSEPACHISAVSFAGAIWGLETLSQLVLSSGAGYTIPQAPWRIEDAPRFPFRGLMVDTARHFLPLNALRRQIDGLSFSKMNVLHWHLTDAQSTPYDSVAYPKLKHGAFAPGLVYTHADIASIVEYARLRGVQVLVEIDMPGHNYAFGIGYPELIVNCTAMYPLQVRSMLPPPCAMPCLTVPIADRVLVLELCTVSRRCGLRLCEEAAEGDHGDAPERPLSYRRGRGAVPVLEKRSTDGRLPEAPKHDADGALRRVRAEGLRHFGRPWQGAHVLELGARCWHPDPGRSRCAQLPGLDGGRCKDCARGAPRGAVRPRRLLRGGPEIVVVDFRRR